jgi:hypothetical protein
MRTRLAVMAIVLAFAPAFARAEPRPSPLDIPELVAILRIDGAPQDSTLRDAFDRGLKLALDEEVLRTEHLMGGAGYVPGLPVSNRFRQLFGDVADGAWQVEITIEGAPEPATSRKPGAPPRPVLDVGFVTRSDAQAKANARPKPMHWMLTATQPPPSAVAYAGALGRAVAVLVLEELHRKIDALRPNDRVVVADFERRRPDRTGNAGGR